MEFFTCGCQATNVFMFYVLCFYVRTMVFNFGTWQRNMKPMKLSLNHLEEISCKKKLEQKRIVFNNRTINLNVLEL